MFFTTLLRISSVYLSKFNFEWNFSSYNRFISTLFFKLYCCNIQSILFLSGFRSILCCTVSRNLLLLMLFRKILYKYLMSEPFIILPLMLIFLGFPILSFFFFLEVRRLLSLVTNLSHVDKYGRVGHTEPMFKISHPRRSSALLNSFSFVLLLRCFWRI